MKHSITNKYFEDNSKQYLEINKQASNSIKYTFTTYTTSVGDTLTQRIIKAIRIILGKEIHNTISLNSQALQYLITDLSLWLSQDPNIDKPYKRLKQWTYAVSVDQINTPIDVLPAKKKYVNLVFIRKLMKQSYYVRRAVTVGDCLNCIQT